MTHNTEIEQPYTDVELAIVERAYYDRPTIRRLVAEVRALRGQVERISSQSDGWLEAYLITLGNCKAAEHRAETERDALRLVVEAARTLRETCRARNYQTVGEQVGARAEAVGLLCRAVDALAGPPQSGNVYRHPTSAR